MKKCSRCHQDKPSSEFASDHARCNECRAEISRNYYHDKQDAMRHQKLIERQRFIHWRAA